MIVLEKHPYYGLSLSIEKQPYYGLDCLCKISLLLSSIVLEKHPYYGLGLSLGSINMIYNCLWETGIWSMIASEKHPHDL